MMARYRDIGMRVWNNNGNDTAVCPPITLQYQLSRRTHVVLNKKMKKKKPVKSYNTCWSVYKQQ